MISSTTISNKEQMDPILFAKKLWPHVHFYKQQKEAIYSVMNDRETVVVAGNMLGKDFVAGFIALWFFLTRHPCRIITTSAKDQHLKVLWGEIGRFIQESKLSLDFKYGGGLVVNHHNLNKIVDGERCPLSYILGMVASPDSMAAMQGHHIPDKGDGIPRTLFMCDESSSVRDEYYTMARTWSHRSFIFGNPWPCNNFFYRAVKGDPSTEDPGGSIPREKGGGYHRRVIKITAEDSPNVQLGLMQTAKGKEPTNEMLIPGVKSYERYLEDRRFWDPIQQCVSLDAEWYEGSEVKLFPSEALKKAREVAAEIERTRGRKRKGKTMGVDPAEGGDNSCWTIGDELGLIYQYSEQTGDTTQIVDITLRLMREFNIQAPDVLFDRGGGGKEHADRLRRMGYPVRTVAFGGNVLPEKRRGITTLEHRKLEDEERYAYVNRRAEMYGLLSRAVSLDSITTYGIPSRMIALHQQLKPIPKLYDDGRLWLPPKRKTPKTDNSTAKTMIELIGHSPDEADSAVLCYYGLVKSVRKPKAGAVR